MQTKSKKLLSYFIKGAVFLVVISAVISIGYITFFLDEITIRDSVTKVDPLPERSVNVLVIGVANGLSDTLMLCHFNPNTNKLDIISVPRDTYYPRKGYNHPAQKKINAAYSAEGADGAVRSVEGLTGLQINYYTKIDYKAVSQIVDAIGGLEVVVPRKMNYDDPADGLHIHYDKGETVHKGKDIVKLLRWRKNNHGGGYDEGDLGRIGMQQEIVKKGIEKILTENTAVNLILIQKPFMDNVKTNMPVNKILYYFSKAGSIKPEAINITTIPVTPKETDGAYYYIADEAKLQEMMEKYKD